MKFSIFIFIITFFITLSLTGCQNTNCNFPTGTEGGKCSPSQNPSQSPAKLSANVTSAEVYRNFPTGTEGSGRLIFNVLTNQTEKPFTISTEEGKELISGSTDKAGRLTMEGNKLLEILSDKFKNNKVVILEIRIGTDSAQIEISNELKIASIKGFVEEQNTGKPIDGAVVTIKGYSITPITTSKGEFLFSETLLKDSGIKITDIIEFSVNHKEYKPFSKQINLLDQNNDYIFKLEKQIITGLLPWYNDDKRATLSVNNENLKVLGIHLTSESRFTEVYVKIEDLLNYFDLKKGQKQIKEFKFVVNVPGSFINKQFPNSIQVILKNKEWKSELNDWFNMDQEGKDYTLTLIPKFSQNEIETIGLLISLNSQGIDRFDGEIIIKTLDVKFEP